MLEERDLVAGDDVEGLLLHQLRGHRRLVSGQGDRNSAFAEARNDLLLVGQKLVVDHRLGMVVEEVGAADDVKLADVRRQDDAVQDIFSTPRRWLRDFDVDHFLTLLDFSRNLVVFRLLVVVEIREILELGVGDDERRVVVTVADVVAAVRANRLRHERPRQEADDGKDTEKPRLNNFFSDTDFFVLLAFHWPGLDGFDQHFQATVHFL